MILALLLAAAAPASPADIALAKATLETSMRDYAGSQFRGFRAVRSTGDKGQPVLALCGEANARNAFGGMTGWRKMAITLEGGRAGRPEVIAIGANGYSDLDLFVKVCPYVGPTATVGPKDAAVDPTDITPALQPVAS